MLLLLLPHQARVGRARQATQIESEAGQGRCQLAGSSEGIRRVYSVGWLSDQLNADVVCTPGRRQTDSVVDLASCLRRQDGGKSADGSRSTEADQRARHRRRRERLKHQEVFQPARPLHGRQGPKRRHVA